MTEWADLRGCYSLAKRAGKLCVLLMGEPYYTPPDFVRMAMKDRRLITELVERLNALEEPIKAIVWFETATRP